MISFLIMNGWSRSSVLFEMNVIEIQTSFIHATRQRLREMRYHASVYAGSIGMLFQGKKDAHKGNILDMLDKQIEKLGENLEGEESSGKKRRDPRLGQRLLSAFSKMMGQEPTKLEVPKGMTGKQAWENSPSKLQIKNEMPKDLF